MKSIWKYELKRLDAQIVRMPKGARVLCVQMQRGEPCIWAAVDDDASREERKFRIFGTGNPFDISDAAEYIGTVQDGHLVWHVFEVSIS